MNKTEYELEDGINDKLHNSNIKRKVWYGGKMNGVYYRRLIEIIVKV